MWVAAFCCALIFQVVREHGRPPFPPCPRQQRLARTRTRRQRELKASSSTVRSPPVEDAAAIHHERTPLLGSDGGGAGVGGVGGAGGDHVWYSEPRPLSASSEGVLARLRTAWRHVTRSSPDVSRSPAAATRARAGSMRNLPNEPPFEDSSRIVDPI